MGKQDLIKPHPPYERDLIQTLNKAAGADLERLSEKSEFVLPTFLDAVLEFFYFKLKGV